MASINQKHFTHMLSLSNKLHFVYCLCAFIVIQLYGSDLCAADKFWGAANKLSNSHVNSVYQDHEGLIWICTDSGLNTFDGTSFKTYYHQPDDSTSLTNNSVLCVFEDKKENFWVGTIGGLQCFDRKTERFRNVRFSYPNINDFSYFRCIMEDSKGNIWLTTSRSGIICIRANTGNPIYYMTTNSNICSNKINVVFEDRFGNIWIGSQDCGISVLNIENHTLVNYAYNPSNPNSLSSNKVFSIAETPEGNILVGTIDGGIDLFNYSTRTFTRNFVPAEGMIFTMMADSKKNLWIGTDGYGLKCYRERDKSIRTYETELPNLDMRKAKVHSILEDKQGNIWIGLYQKGILMIPPQERSFGNLSFNPFYPNKSIGTECVLSILEDHGKNLWIGTDGDGLYKLNARKEVVAHHKIRVDGHYTESVVLSIFEDRKDRIWIGTYLSGLFLYDPVTDSFERKEIVVNGRTVKHINTISEDAQGNLWLGTNEDGVCVYNPDTKTVSAFQYNLMKSKGQILSNTIHTITFGKNHKVWIGTSGAGLSCYDLLKHSFTDYTFENGKLTSNMIYSVAEDKAGNIWVGTAQGFNCIDTVHHKIDFYTERDGLPHATINGIEIDNKGDLWLSTNLGLSHFRVKDKAFTNYFHSDGIVSNEFRRGAHFKSDSGEMFFGGINGVSYFRLFKKAKHPLLNLAFTDLYIYNKPVKVGEKGILSQAINYADKIDIDDDVKSFSVGFTALEYNAPGDIVYQIKLEGFDNEWKTLPLNNRLATYTNLNYGKYVFKVRAALPEMESIERSLVIIIHPPFWLTWWAKLIYACMVVLMICYVYITVKNRLKVRKEAMKRQNESLMMQSKLQFFTDISHEIRTPLTLILTPIEQLMKETPEGKLLNTYKLISQNGHRILRLVNQVMEMRKLDRGQVKLATEQTDVRSFFGNIMSSFDYTAKERGITLTLDIQEDIPQMWIDQEKMDKVVFNVLSNAFKYTPDGGAITIEIRTTHTDMVIRIADSGESIPEEMRELVFERFYQIPNESNHNKVGTGIGLHLSRSLMNIHHGNIYVEDSEHPGAVFVITLPLDASYLKESERKTGHSDRNLATLVQSSLVEAGDSQPSHPAVSVRTKFKYKILIVEDDGSIKDYLFDVLKEDYQLITAENGEKGLEQAIKELPDCIITDVMMPVMDGIEMCNKIKNNDQTNSIPVIMLTARTSIEHRIEGLQAGADSYLPKPFNIDHLKVRINKLIELRRVIKGKYEDREKREENTTAIKSFDEKFLEKLETIVREQLSDTDLSVETISEKIGISRSQLQRKLKQLTNQNPSEYIKTTRLKYAAALLSSKKLTISEVTYAAGFSSLSHFSNSFKEYYGMSPTRYVEINSEEKAES